MNTPGQSFRALPGLYALCRLNPGSPVPAWAAGPFVSVTQTAEEVSIVCAVGQVPAEVRAERNWRVLKVDGPLPFTAVGVLASMAGPLGQAGISLVPIGTFDTDYLLVKTEAFDRAIAVLVAAGHRHAG